MSNIRTLQKALTAAGFSPGPADGAVGPMTTAALVAAAKAGKLVVAREVRPAADEPAWLTLARAHIGQQEIAGPRNNPVIVGWWSTIHSGWFTEDETPWCAAFAGAMLEQAGIRSSRSAASRSYETWGQPLAAPVPGCIVVFRRDGGGHVGFVVGRDAAGNLMVLGGNQGDAVSIKPFLRDRVLAYRWPVDIAIPDTPLPLMTSDGRISNDEA